MYIFLSFNIDKHLIITHFLHVTGVCPRMLDRYCGKVLKQLFHEEIQKILVSDVSTSRYMYEIINYYCPYEEI